MVEAAGAWHSHARHTAGHALHAAHAGHTTRHIGHTACTDKYIVVLGMNSMTIFNSQGPYFMIEIDNKHEFPFFKYAKETLNNKIFIPLNLLNFPPLLFLFDYIS